MLGTFINWSFGGRGADCQALVRHLNRPAVHTAWRPIIGDVAVRDSNHFTRFELVVFSRDKRIAIAGWPFRSRGLLGTCKNRTENHLTHRKARFFGNARHTSRSLLHGMGCQAACAMSGSMVAQTRATPEATAPITASSVVRAWSSARSSGLWEGGSRGRIEAGPSFSARFDVIFVFAGFRLSGAAAVFPLQFVAKY